MGSLSASSEWLLEYGTSLAGTLGPRTILVSAFRAGGTAGRDPNRIDGTNRSFGASAGKRFGSASHFIVVKSRGRSPRDALAQGVGGNRLLYATTADATSQGRSGVSPLSYWVV
jgi:hypothetical protein